MTENNITFELEHDVRIIARNLGLSQQETKDMMQKMIDLGLFSLTQNTKIACYALAKRLDQSMTSNPKMRQLISDIKENHDSIMTQSCKIRKEEIRKEENREYIVPKVTKFQKPTLEEIQTEIQAKGYAVDADRFFAHYESNGWRVGRNPMKSWQMALVTWNKSEYKKPNNDRNSINASFNNLEAGEREF